MKSILSAQLLATLSLASALSAAPSILNSVQPASITAGANGAYITVRGNGFEVVSKVLWNGSSLDTEYQGPTMLRAYVPPVFLRSVGTATLRVNGSDGMSGPVQIAVEPALTVLTPAALAPAIVSRLYSFAIATAGGSPPFRYSVLYGALPPGFSLSPNSGAITGLASADGNYEFTIEVSDSTGVTVTRVFTIQILRELVIASAALPRATAGSAYTFALQSIGGAMPHRDWTVAAGTLPAGVTLTSEGVLSGVPANAGTHSFTVRLKDSAGLIATRALTLEVAPQLAIAPPAALPTLTSGGAFSFRFSAAGGTPPYVWSVTSGQLPAGLSLDPREGHLTGFPTAPGEFKATVTATDAAGQRVSIPIALTVIDSLAITTEGALAAAIAGAPYSQMIAAAGGAPPYRFSLFSGALPAGLALDTATGRISGTPSTPGSAAFAISVIDSSGRSASRSFTLGIGVPAMPALQYVAPASIAPAQQTRVGLSLAGPYPMEVTGSLRMSNEKPDPGAVFSNGQTSVRFRFAPNSTVAEFDAPSLALQSGTTAGALFLEARFDGAPSQPAPHVLQVQSAAPVVREVRVARTASGFEVILTGFSPTRELKDAAFKFTGDSLPSAEIAVPLSSLAAQWYDSPNSRPYGAQFTYRQPFTVTGLVSQISGVSVALSNTVGTSTSAPAAF